MFLLVVEFRVAVGRNLSNLPCLPGLRVDCGVKAYSAAESSDLRNHFLSIDKNIIDLTVEDFGDTAQQAALESQRQGCSRWLCDCHTCLSHIYTVDGLAREAAVGCVQPYGRSEPKDERLVNQNSLVLLEVFVYLPNGCHTMLLGGQDWKDD